ncbi:phosphotransferase [Nocardia tengchongensis]|uniref:phosphotransferase n=1 Tax=Nocardia tengchongensis TaxID=2055889 RepID=UPI00369E86D3
MTRLVNAPCDGAATLRWAGEGSENMRVVVFEGVARRDEWPDLPEPVREAMADRLGGRVVSAVNQRGGYSHGMASVLTLADGSRVFAKAVRDSDGLARAYRVEATAAQGLSELVSTPAVLFTLDSDGWFVVVFEFVDGRHPDLSRPNELRAVLALLARMAEALTPSPLAGIPTVAGKFGPILRSWSRFAEQGAPPDLNPWAVRHLERLADLETRWLDRAGGDTLLHTDLRPDNLLIDTGGSVSVVDWAWPCRGAAWLDLAALAPAIASAGVDPDPILVEHPVTADLDPAAIDSFLCALAGYWSVQSRQSPPPRSPGLRLYQARAAQTSLSWLEFRTRWP